jgi:thiol:disulfide interchange protein DsbD
MAIPYLVLCSVPAWTRWLPRPGAWMAQFKSFMAFPMFATVVWLVWVLGQQVGVGGMSALLALLVAVAFATWAFGAAGLGKRARATLGALAVLALAGTADWMWSGMQPQAAPAVAEASPRWRAWSRAAVDQAMAERRPVFVDFTAAWCVTCQFNKRHALADAGVLADFETRQVLLLRADWTLRDAEVTQELARLGRGGVPVYALYSPGAAAPQLLPEILTVAELRRRVAELPLATDLSATRPTRSIE